MALKRIESWADDRVCLVRVADDGGIEGWGQCAPYHADLTARVLHEVVLPHLGAADDDPRGLAERVIRETYKFTGTFVCRALAGIETALWDLAGKRAGKPVCALLGGTPRRVPVYGSSMRRDIAPADEAGRMRRWADEHGVGAFKCRIGARMGALGSDADAWPGRTPELVPLLRRELGDGIVLVADANGAYTAGGAIGPARLLADHGYAFLEEPCPFTDVDATAAVRAQAPLPIAGGEQDFLDPQWRRICGLPAVDVVQPDVGYIGGVERTCRVAAMAADAGLRCTPHCANPSLLQVFTLHVLSAIGNPWDYMEYSIEDPVWAAELYDPAPCVVDGAIACPDGPGWGVAIRAGRLEGTEHRTWEP